MTAVYRQRDLAGFASSLFKAAGLKPDRAEIGAAVLVEGDLLGRDTHGLAQLPAYLNALATGTMARDAEIVTVSDHGAVAVWDGQRNLGPWLVHTGIELGMQRARQYGVFNLAIRRSHHIAALSAYLKRATDEGFLVILSSSDPSTASVAPPGGTQAMITPNPMAAGIPTGGAPVLIDISMSTTTNGMVERHRREGRNLPYPWLLDADGVISDDPEVFFTEPKGSILPLGGKDLGYKGFSMGFLTEILTSALSGFGRADPSEGWGASVFLQVLWPDAFGGASEFQRQADHLVKIALDNKRVKDGPAVRLPGRQALALRDKQLREGVGLHPSIIPALEPWALKLDVPLPTPLG